MNAEQFISYLDDPRTLGKDSSNELAGLIQQYPYFQTAHLLYLKSLHIQKSLHYPNQLKIAASYANDRKKLYQLVMQEDLHEQIKIVDGLSGDDKKISDISPLEEQILQEAVNASIQLEVKNKPNDEYQEEKPQVKEVDDKNGSAIAEPMEDISTPRPFNQWLKTLNQESHSVEEQETEAEEPQAEEPQQGNDLIQKFIQERPRIGDHPSGPSKGELQAFFSPIETAKLGLIDDESFVTETLAKIYEAQGYHLKAKTAYEMLSLKYPEKKANFAARIKSLEVLIQDKTKGKSQ